VTVRAVTVRIVTGIWESSKSRNPPPREWRTVNKAHTLGVSGDVSTKSGRDGKKKLADLTFLSEIAGVLLASVFEKFTSDWAGELDDSADSTILTVMGAVSYTTENLETGEGDKEQLRYSPLFMGSPWQDGAIFLQANDTAGHIPKDPVTTTQTKLQLDYEPDDKRHFGIVNLTFEMNSELWILVEVVLEGAHPHNKPPWQNGITFNWAHLQTKTTPKCKGPCALSNRLEVIPLECVGRVRAIVEDPNHPIEHTVRSYWCPIEIGTVPFDEVLHYTSKYERHAQLNEQGHSAQHFEDAMAVQPWDLWPPSVRSLERHARAAYDRAAVSLPLGLDVQPEDSAAAEAAESVESQ